MLCESHVLEYRAGNEGPATSEKIAVGRRSSLSGRSGMVQPTDAKVRLGDSCTCFVLFRILNVARKKSFLKFNAVTNSSRGCYNWKVGVEEKDTVGLPKSSA